MKNEKFNTPFLNVIFMVTLYDDRLLCIWIIILYYRLIENKTKDLEKQNTIISFHQYVKENIK